MEDLVLVLFDPFDSIDSVDPKVNVAQFYGKVKFQIKSDHHLNQLNDRHLYFKYFSKD